MTKQVEFADIGCGFGGLLVALSPVFPDTLMVGKITFPFHYRPAYLILDHYFMNDRLTDYESDQEWSSVPKSSATSTPASTPYDPYHHHKPKSANQTPQTSNQTYLLKSDLHHHQQSMANTPTSRPSATNAMKFLPQYFPKSSLSKIFLCFPDPHFKARKHKARIVSRQLCAEYAYVLKRGGGIVYTITDVEELARWIEGCFDGRNGDRKVEAEVEAGADEAADTERGEEEKEEGIPDISSLFTRITGPELESDPCVRIMSSETEEAKKVTRNGGRKFIGVWRRREDPGWI